MVIFTFSSYTFTLPRLLLLQVLDQDSNVPIEYLCLTFALDVERFDKVVTIALEPNGESTPVTEDNRQRYAELYVDYLLNKSVEK